MYKFIAAYILIISPFVSTALENQAIFDKLSKLEGCYSYKQRVNGAILEAVSRSAQLRRVSKKVFELDELKMERVSKISSDKRGRIFFSQTFKESELDYSVVARLQGDVLAYRVQDQVFYNDRSKKLSDSEVIEGLYNTIGRKSLEVSGAESLRLTPVYIFIDQDRRRIRFQTTVLDAQSNIRLKLEEVFYRVGSHCHR